MCSHDVSVIPHKTSLTSLEAESLTLLRAYRLDVLGVDPD